MKEIVKQVTVGELYEVYAKKRKEPISEDDFLHLLATWFLNRPAEEFRFHDVDDPETVTTYVLKNVEIANALQKKRFTHN